MARKVPQSADVRRFAAIDGGLMSKNDHGEGTRATKRPCEGDSCCWAGGEGAEHPPSIHRETSAVAMTWGREDRARQRHSDRQTRLGLEADARFHYVSTLSVSSWTR